MNTDTQQAGSFTSRPVLACIRVHKVWVTPKWTSRVKEPAYVRTKCGWPESEHHVSRSLHTCAQSVGDPKVNITCQGACIRVHKVWVTPKWTSRVKELAYVCTKCGWPESEHHVSRSLHTCAQSVGDPKVNITCQGACIRVHKVWVTPKWTSRVKELAYVCTKCGWPESEHHVSRSLHTCAQSVGDPKVNITCQGACIRVHKVWVTRKWTSRVKGISRVPFTVRKI